MSLADEDRGYDYPTPPVPVVGCQRCKEFETRRTYAAGRDDRSGVTDAVVLLRVHLAAAH